MHGHVVGALEAPDLEHFALCEAGAGRGGVRWCGEQGATGAAGGGTLLYSQPRVPRSNSAELLLSAS